MNCSLIESDLPPRYIGNEFGTVSVVQFSKLQRKLSELPYAIPASVTLGEYSKILILPSSVCIISKNVFQFNVMMQVALLRLEAALHLQLLVFFHSSMLSIQTYC